MSVIVVSVDTVSGAVIGVVVGGAVPLVADIEIHIGPSAAAVYVGIVVIVLAGIVVIVVAVIYCGVVCAILVPSLEE